MSSHHIIRDEQEPPVMVFQMNDNWQQISELLGWSPILLINPELTETFNLRQTKFDGYLINENESAGEKQEFVYREDNLSQAILKWIDKKDCTALNLFCDQDLMIDLFEQFSKDVPPISIIFFTEKGKHILKPKSIFKKWYPKKLRIDILNDKIVGHRNLTSINNEYYVENDGFVMIEVEDDLILIREAATIQ